MTFGNDFVTYSMSVPASRKGQNVSYLRDMESRGKSIETLFAGTAATDLEKSMTGYIAAYDEKTKRAVLTVTTLKKNESLLQTAMSKALKYRGKGMFSDTAKKQGMISSVETPYIPVSAEGLSPKAVAGAKYSLLRDLGVQDTEDPDTLRLPANIRYTRRMQSRLATKASSEQTVLRPEESIIWKQELDRDRKRRALNLGVDPKNLRYEVPAGGKSEIPQDFIDKQNKFLDTQRKQNGSEKSSSFIASMAKLLASVFFIQRTVLKLYEVAKQGADRGLSTAVSSIELGVAPEVITQLQEDEQKYGVAPGTTEKGLSRLLTAFNSPEALESSEKQIRGLALLGSGTSQQGKLVQSAVNVAVNGGNIMDVFYGIRQAASELIAKNKDPYGRTMPTKAQSTREVLRFISANLSPEIASLMSHEYQYSGNRETANAGGIKPSSNEVLHAASLATALSELTGILTSLKEKIASWVDRSGIINKISDFLISHWGTKEEKAEMVSYNQQINKSRMEATKSTLAAIQNSGDVKEYYRAMSAAAESIGYSPEAKIFRSSSFGKVSMKDMADWSVGKSSTPFDLADVSAFMDSFRKKIRKMNPEQKAVAEKWLSYMPDMALSGLYAEGLQNNLSSYNPGKETVTMMTPQTVLDVTRGNLETGTSKYGTMTSLERMSWMDWFHKLSSPGPGRSEVYGNREVAPGLSRTMSDAAVMSGIISPALDKLLSLSAKPAQVDSKLDLTNNIKVVVPGGESDYSDSKSYNYKGTGGRKINAVNGSIYNLNDKFPSGSPLSGNVLNKIK